MFVGQYHYVGLDKLPLPALPIVDNPAQPNHSEPAYDDRPDEAITAEGDEHRRQTSGAPQTENSESLCVLTQLKERDH